MLQPTSERAGDSNKHLTGLPIPQNQFWAMTYIEIWQKNWKLNAWMQIEN